MIPGSRSSNEGGEDMRAQAEEELQGVEQQITRAQTRGQETQAPPRRGQGIKLAGRGTSK